MGKLAIVGMDALFSVCDGLDAFDRTIYEGKQQLLSLASQRWQNWENKSNLQVYLAENGFINGELPKGFYIQDEEINFLGDRALSTPDNTAISPDLLMRKVADRALQDAGIKAGDRVAVIIGEISNNNLQSKDKINPSINKINNHAIASNISSQWHFPSPNFSGNISANTLFQQLKIAEKMLNTQEVDAVLIGAVDIIDNIEKIIKRNYIGQLNTGNPTLSFDSKSNGWMIGEGAGAIVVKNIEQTKENRIYAIIDAITCSQENLISESPAKLPLFPSSQIITKTCQQAFSQAGISPENIGYLEVYASGIEAEDTAEIAGLLSAYQTNQNDLTCGMGSIKANIGYTYTASGIASLIKTALCLYHRYIPATPQWSNPKSPEKWQDSPFYVTINSLPWLLSETTSKRIAAISNFNNLGSDRTYTHLILSEDINQISRNSKYLEQTPLYLFPLTAYQPEKLLEKLHLLQQDIINTTSLATAASQAFITFQKQAKINSPPAYTVAIVGKNTAELNQEIQKAIKGIPQAFQTNNEWSTPGGSYFTPNPLGKEGKIAFVYPGAFTSYLNQFRDNWRLFPALYHRINKISHQQKQTLYTVTRKLYPRSLSRLSPRQMEGLENHLMNDATMMLISGIIASKAATTIIQECFKITPQAAFGYSLAELSMMFALDVYTDTNHLMESAKSYPLFKTRLSGPKNAVRDYWGLPQSQESDDFWNVYVLLTSPEKVRECLQSESRVYLTHINTDKEVVIAGDKQGCIRVIEQLQCDYLRAPINHVLHCEPMNSEYDKLVEWLSLPISYYPPINFYSAAEYDYTQLDREKIAHNIAKALCQPLDFPHLINRVYQDGIRFFLELGAGNTCTRWIRETLKNKHHIAVAIDTRGIPNHTSIIRTLAKLVSHQVNMDISSLYCSIFPQKALVNSPNISPLNLNLNLNLNTGEDNYKQFHENLHNFTQNHLAFLRSRQQSLQQLSQLIQQQIIIAENILNPQKNTNIIFNETEILEIAQGNISKVFGKKYIEIDTYPKSTRVPMPPYLFISRVTKLEAKFRCFEPCSITTEYDIKNEAWYLMGNQVPCGVCLETFQSNIFLASYLGIDLEFKGKKVYRVLGGKVTFTGNLPERGDTLRCIVKITSFSRLENTIIFFYNYQGFIGDRLFIFGEANSGLFSEEELNQGQGIILSKLDKLAKNQENKQYFQPLLHCDKTFFSEEDIIQLSQGNLANCFGCNYNQQGRNPLLKFPNSSLRMLDRITSINPTGGAWGLGLITGEKTLNLEDWYFTCHFKNDYCMPGTAISEGCIQLILFYMLYLGLQNCTVNGKIQPYPNLTQTVRYRGQITPTSAILTYQIEVTEIGIKPQPYVKADAVVIFKNKIIAMMKNIGIQISETA